MPTARRHHVAVTGQDGRIYVMGGNVWPGVVQVRDTNEIYNPATNTWAPGAPMPHARYSAAAACGLDGRIYVIGGYNSVAWSTVQIYSPSTDAWSTGTPMPTARFGARAALSLDGLVYVIGGDAQGGGQNVATVEAYNPATDSWTTKAPLPVPLLGHQAVTLPDGRILVFGGGSNGTIANYSFVYDPAADAWTMGPTTLREHRDHSAAVAVAGVAYAFSGWTGTSPNDTVSAFCEAFASGKWTAVASIPTPRFGSAAAPGPNGAVYVIGGDWPDTGGSASGIVERYQPEPPDFANYTITDIGPTGSFGLVRMNNAGEVVTATNASGGFRTLLWLPQARDGFAAGLNDLGGMLGVYSYPMGINEKGEMAVRFWPTVSDYWQDASQSLVYLPKPAYGLPSGSTLLPRIPSYPRSYVHSINNAGQMVGNCNGWNGSEVYAHATLWNGLQAFDLGSLGGPYSGASSINDAGLVAGNSCISGSTGSGPWHAYLWTPTAPNGSTGSMQDIGTLGGTSSAGGVLNSNGEIAGTSDVSGGGYHPYLYSGGVMRDLSGPGGPNGEGSGINDAGDVVGYLASNSGQVAMLWRAGAGVDLNTLIPQGSGWVLRHATDTNDRGQIVGFGYLNGQGHAFLLTPVPVVHAPTNLVARLNSSTQAQLAWLHDGAAVDGFIVERKVGAAPFADYATFTSAAVRGFTDNAVTPGQPNTYRVCAVKASERSAYSNEASVTSGCGNDEYGSDSDTVLLDHFNGATVAEKVGGSLAYVSSLEGLSQAANFQSGVWSRYALPGWYTWSPDYAPEGKEGTVELWVYPRRYETNWLTFNWNSSDTPPGSGYVLNLFTDAQGRVRVTIWDAINEPRPTTDPFPTGSTVLPLNAWTHVAYAWSLAGTRLYVNGVVDASSPYNYYPALNPTFYAYVNAWGDRELGYVDEIRISKVARFFFSTLPTSYSLPGDIAPVGTGGLNQGSSGARFGDGKVDLLDAVYALRVYAGLNFIP
jgi:N-acetylneuraminic acid mutarotase